MTDNITTFCSSQEIAINDSHILHCLERNWNTQHTFSLFTDDNTVAQQRDDQWHCELDLTERNWQIWQTIHYQSIYQSGISLNLRTGPTGHAALFNKWESVFVFIKTRIKTSTCWSKFSQQCGRESEWDRISHRFEALRHIFKTFHEAYKIFLSGQRIGSHIGSVSWNIQHILWLFLLLSLNC